MAEPTRALVTYLRANLTDYNSTNRTGGSQWIFDNLPQVQDLKKNHYPRIGMEVLAEPGELAGAGSSDMISPVTIRMNIYVYKDIVVSSMQGQVLVNKIGRDILSALRQNWVTDSGLKTEYFSYGVVGNRPLPFDEIRGLFRRQVDVQVLTINPGE